MQKQNQNIKNKNIKRRIRNISQEEAQRKIDNFRSNNNYPNKIKDGKIQTHSIIANNKYKNTKTIYQTTTYLNENYKQVVEKKIIKDSQYILIII